MNIIRTLECTDIVSPAKRSEMMSKVRSKNSIAEKKVRAVLHAEGFRFRLHRKDLPGTPDIVLPKYSIAILVHGCFWHRHEMCSRASTPKSNKDFWEKKFAENVIRDNKNKQLLTQLGWRVIIIWECETKNKEFKELLKRKLLNEDHISND